MVYVAHGFEPHTECWWSSLARSVEQNLVHRVPEQLRLKEQTLPHL